MNRAAGKAKSELSDNARTLGGFILFVFVFGVFYITVASVGVVVLRAME